MILIRNKWLKWIIAILLFSITAILLYHPFYIEFVTARKGQILTNHNDLISYILVMIFFNFTLTAYVYELMKQLERPIIIEKNKLFNGYLLTMILITTSIIISVSQTFPNLWTIIFFLITMLALMTQNKDIMLHKLTSLKFIIPIFILTIITNKNILEYLLEKLTKQEFSIASPMTYAPFPIALNNNTQIVWWGIILNVIFWTSIYFTTVLEWYNKDNKKIFK